MYAMHWASPAVYHMHTQYCMTLNPTHPTQPGFFLVLPVGCLLLRCLPILQSHLFMCLFTWLLLERFCSRFFPLFFPHLAGSLGNFGPVHFGFCCSLFCECLDVLHVPEFLSLVGFCSVLLAGSADNHLRSKPL